MEGDAFAQFNNLRKNLIDMASDGCKRDPVCGPGDGRCFNCQAFDIVNAWNRKRGVAEMEAGIRRKDSIIASLKTDLVAAAARHEADRDLMDQCADAAGGGRAYARYQVEKLSDLALDMAGALIEAEEKIEFLRVEVQDLRESNAETTVEERCIG